MVAPAELEGPTITGSDVSVAVIASSDNNIHDQRQSRPQITIGTSAEYRHRLADISSRASETDPLNVLFEHDKAGGNSVTVDAARIYKGSLKRLETKIKAGAMIVEACNFAAAACWEPPSAVPDSLTEAELAELAIERPVFAEFLRLTQKSRNDLLGKDVKPWYLTLMARDPERKDKGAVRAVIEPFVAKAKEEKVPLWLVAGNERARDVYGYLGFRVVEVIYTFPQQRMSRGNDDGVAKEATVGIPSWCMVCNFPPE